MNEFPYTEPISEYIQGYQIGFEDGKTGTLANKVNSIEESNFNPQMLKSCTDTSYQCGYEQGTADGIDMCIKLANSRFWLTMPQLTQAMEQLKEQKNE